ncbi:MAG: hypothetical protein H0U95_16455 [Bacteroidetes bacterium]|nr:hypothetical protein [Bacteroidota bacterium]
MCFSAGASFTAAAVLGTIGVASLKKVNNRAQLMYGCIPLLFAIQQVSEGLLWLTLTHFEYGPWKMAATYFFLFFAQFLWPIWIPASLFIMEPDKKRKKILSVAVIAGISASVILAYRLIFNNVNVEVREHHIQYDIETSQILILLSSIFYVIAIITPNFISSAKGTKAVAYLLLFSLLATKIFYEVYLISVWCFFAATTSVLILRVLKLSHSQLHLTTKKWQLRSFIDRRFRHHV